MSITIADIEAARRTIAGQVLRTPIARACVLCPKTNRRDEKMASEQPNNHSVGVQPGAQAGSRTRRRRLRLSRRAASRLITHAWVDYPIKDIVSRLGDYQLPTAPNAVAQDDASARK